MSRSRHRRPTGRRHLAAVGAGVLAAGLLVLAGGTAVSAGESAEPAGPEHSRQVPSEGR
ncbi:hypothetical protein [Streptomyces xiamenensis]|uniref:hypothetical protein n=1 Tax=Streptomyces xiamenensis TaxID=408015 RepID=UPI0037D56972